MAFLILLTIAIPVRIFFIRYFPVKDLQGADLKNTNFDVVDIIDLRDYNESYKNPIEEAINIPTAYLKRYYNEIPNHFLHVIASDSLEKNVGIRFLRQKGYNVVGYTILAKNLNVQKNNFNIKINC